MTPRAAGLKIFSSRLHTVVTASVLGPATIGVSRKSPTGYKMVNMAS